MEKTFLNVLFNFAVNGLYVTLDAAGCVHPAQADAAEFPEISVDVKQLAAETTSPFIVYPLSTAQFSLFYESQIHSNSTAYQINAPIYYETPLDPERLEHSFQQVVNRHAALRTTFKRIDNQYIQRILLTKPAEIVMRELSDASMETIETTLAKDVVIPVDIFQTSHTLYAYKFNDKIVASVLIVHHAVGDLSSAATIIDDWGRVLENPEAMPMDDPYILFTQSQIENETGKAAEKNKNYWLKQLTPLPQATELPTNYAHASLLQQNSSDHKFTVETDLRNKIQTLAEEQKTDELTILLSVFQVFLARYSNVWDTNISLTFPTSIRRKYPDVIAFGIQEAPLLASIDPQSSLVNLLADNRTRQFTLFKYRDFSLLNLSSELGLTHDLSRAAIAQVSFIPYPDRGHHILRECSMVTMGYLSNPMTYGDVVFRFLPAKVPHWSHELSLISGWHPESFLPLIFRYHTSLFSPQTIKRMANNYLTLLQDAVHHPDKPLVDLQILSDEERRQLTTWGSNPAPFESGRLIPDLFESQSAATPNATALIVGEQQLTYAELNQQANAVAHYLQTEHNIHAEDTVGMLFLPSVEMIVSILGILKAGAAFVPIDPDIPQARVERIIEDAQLKLILSHEPLASGPLSQNLNVINVPELITKYKSIHLENPLRILAPENLAYIFFTSGSTGFPKGVMIQHDSFLASQLSWNQSPGIAPIDKVLSVYNYAFDASLGTNIAPLLAGACVVLATQGERQDPRLLIQLMERNGVTAMCATTSHYRLLILGGWKGSSQIKAISEGEAFSDDVASFLLDNCREVWNAYGPTEASNVVSVYKLVPLETPISIGSPSINANLYVLDDHGRQVPIGVRGELAVGGIYVSRGYINRAELTTKHFTPDSFSSDSNARLYRTGDVVAFRGDGMLMYYGRNDHQVKIRGYRIETGEIEYAILQISGVASSIVRPFKMSNSAMGLVAYLVPVATGVINSNLVREHLANNLPAYMIPDAFIIIETLPLTPNGKLNSSALPPPDLEIKHTPESTSGAELNQDEARVLHIWEGVLGRRGFALADNFFEVGGDSLSLMSVILEIEKDSGTHLPLPSIIQTPTISEMARLLQKISRSGPEDHSVLVPIKTTGDSAPFFCVTAGYGDVIAYQKWDSLLEEKQPFYILQPPQEQSDGLNIHEIAAMYLTALHSIQDKGPYIIMGHSIGGLIAYEMAQQLAYAGQQVNKLILIDTFPGSLPNMKIMLDWVSAIMGMQKTKTRNQGLIKTILQDEGWKTLLKALNGYQIQPYHGDVTLIVTRWSKAYLRIDQWKRLIFGKLNVIETAGNHHTMLREHAATLLSLLKD